MKPLIVALSILCLFTSCKTDKKEEQSNQEESKTLTIAEKIANANGFENWKDVSEISFTFNVDRDTTHFERSWSWKPKTNDVTMITAKDTVHYNRKSVDSLSLKADQAFINDKYWLLAPYQLVWDNGTTISEPVKAEAPISKTQLNKITLTYSNAGGYTPGDAYDFYYGDDFMLKEWVYRQGNSEEPSMMTTWEDYQDYNGITIAKTHKTPENNLKLYFTDIKVIDLNTASLNLNEILNFMI